MKSFKIISAKSNSCVRCKSIEYTMKNKAGVTIKHCKNCNLTYLEINKCKCGGKIFSIPFESGIIHQCNKCKLTYSNPKEMIK